ncbi:hypothetical protein CFR80_17510, partial [Komagataeibacter oboediens]
RISPPPANDPYQPPQMTHSEMLEWCLRQSKAPALRSLQTESMEELGKRKIAQEEEVKGGTPLHTD